MANSAFSLAREQYASLGVDVDAALTTLATVPISLHCWQGDDVGGFENSGESLGGGVAANGDPTPPIRYVEARGSRADRALSRLGFIQYPSCRRP